MSIKKTTLCRFLYCVGGAGVGVTLATMGYTLANWQTWSLLCLFVYGWIIGMLEGGLS